MQILINIIAFLLGVGVGYLYGYYVRSRRALRILNESIEVTLREQQLLRDQYSELKGALQDLKQQRFIVHADLPLKVKKRLR